ncbi:MAG: IS30 family transposase [Candidatus Thiodiazotropha sp. (ex Lucinoma aequizonata)]|nr:IS30 family transposase [Candidatus Thiodiazotropha sp. (ex Lucinoma aequizonata)]
MANRVSTCQLNNVILSHRGVSPINGCFDASQRQIIQIRRFYSIPQTPDSVITRIETLIRQELNPQQVVDYLKRHKRLSLHHETVYGLVYEDKAAGGDLYNHLRVASKPYRKRYGHYDRRGKIKNRVDIDERPAIVESRCRIGDWEGDTVMGKGLKSALLTMVERKRLYTVIMRLTGKQSGLLAEAAVTGLKALKS